MSTRITVSLHHTAADTVIDANIHHSGALPFASLTVGDDDQIIEVFSYDPIFLRRLSNVASALAHDLESARADAQVSV